MFKVLYAYFERNFKLSDDDIVLIESLFVPKVLEKGEHIVKEGEVPRYAAFVCKGILRSYLLDKKGKEHIIQFAPEGWWISAKPGPSEDTPSSVSIDAIEPADVLLLERRGHFTLMEKIPGYATMFLHGMQKRSEAKEARIVNSLTATAEERYHDFLKTYPTIAQRVPLQMLAAYLGITSETVSRIRRKAMSKK